MKRSGFGKGGSSSGMYSGGYKTWIYGIKNIIGLIIEENWGDFI